jgi:hypothetical protein
MNLYLIFWISGLSLAIEQGYLETFGKPMKPFSCAVCLSLWIGIITALLTGNYLYAFVPFFVTKLSSKFLWS